MKYFFFTICFCVMTAFFGSCKKDSHETVPAFNYEQAAGKWVPYELTENGTIHSISSTTTSIFGSYASSVQLNKDKTFIPIVWYDKNTFTFQTSETGTFEYLASNRLRFNGWFKSEWDILKFEGDDLWLKMYSTSVGEILYKFKRQH